MMKKKLLLAMLLCSTLAMTSVAADLFTCDVKVGSSEGISLVFGQAAADDVKPFPPFSGMFGVKDVYLANEKNFAAVTVEGDMARVSTDLRKDATQWVIVANSNASLKFEMTNAEKIYCSYTDPKKKELKQVEIANGGTLSVKAGVSYTLALNEFKPVVKPAQDKMNMNAVATKDDETKSYIAEAEVDGLTAGSTYTFNFVCDGEVGELTRGDKDWMVDLADATDVTWGDNKVTFKAPADGEVTFTAAATSGSAKPLNATLLDAQNTKVAAINAVLQKLLSLNFSENPDGPSANEARYFTNFIKAQGLEYPEDVAWEDLKPFTNSKATKERMEIALRNLKECVAELNFGNDPNGTSSNDARYYTNFIKAQGLDYPEDVTWEDLKPFTNSKATEEKMETALGAIKEGLE